MEKGLILGIETSCDETSVAIVERGQNVLAEVTATSMESFADLGGVIPEEAARKQLHVMIPVLEEALRKWGGNKEDVDAIAVTKGPGLLGSLLIGTMTARVLASAWHKPLMGVHHIFGHLSSSWIGASDQPKFPVLTLSVSGGHTEVWLRESHTKGLLLSRTRDDAAGEAFDKGAVLLGLPYPGGAALSALAQSGNGSLYPFNVPLNRDPSKDFSFSGLKTALRYAIRDLGDDAKHHFADLAASYEATIVRHLVDRVDSALDEHHVQELHVVGGVSANGPLQKACKEIATRRNITSRIPSAEYRTDNAAMIAAGAYFLYEEKREKAFETFETVASLPLTEAIN